MTRRKRSRRFAAAGFCASLSAAPAMAQPSPPEPDQRQPPTAGPTADGQAQAEEGIWTRSNLLGDLDGLRPKLAQHGLTFGLEDVNEVYANPTGGVHRGATYGGLTLMELGIDTEKGFGLPGGTFNISALQIRGRNISEDNLHNLQTISESAAEPATRLWELWYQQSFLDDRLDIKVGQQSVELEFMLSSSANTFINSAMGWPALTALNLYAGGPAYPLSSLGVRFRARPTDAITVLAGVFDDNPPGGPFDDDSQVRGAEQSGTKFNLNTGALFIGEIQYVATLPGDLPGTYKFGGWYDSGAFPDPRFDNAGFSLADPNGTGTPRMHRGNYGFYGMVDQTVFSPKATPTLTLFARLTGGPGDRNLVDFSADGGVTVKGPLPGREGDTFGAGFGIVHISPSARGFDKDVAFFTSGLFPVRTAESFIEVTYQFAAAPWLTLQPDFQYVFNTGGGIPNPSNPSQRVGNAAVFGFRTDIVF
ncbi:MAG: carbohydrate porin [Acetobacteraceae bacterium]|nr:carbohydrate porin [Acetobacteraceae bacterium]